MIRSYAARTVITFALGYLVFMAYAPGLTGSLFYDDFSNLNALAGIDNLSAAWDFIISGLADTNGTGRPLALATFLPHAGGWPNNSSEVLLVNVIIHIVNAGLLFLLTYQILRLKGDNTETRVYLISLNAALLWAVLPLLASTSLIAVQRMTGLAALVGLTGLVVFLRGYFIQDPRQAAWMQFVGLSLGTILAMLSKENGVLIPVYALVIDSVLLQQQSATQKRLFLFRRVALWMTLLALLLYLSPIHLNWFELDLRRGWTAFERMQTEGVILWKYLFSAFMPQPTLFGPFHDNVQLVQGWFYPTLAFGGFLLLTTIAYFVRRKTPWPLFALLWFFTGHLLESTTLSLELMFEHRNYLALYGFCLALTYGAWHLPGSLRRVGPLLFVLYLIMMWSILYATTSLWGNKLEAAENWATSNPDSPRAILHMTTEYHNTLGNASFALPALDRAIAGCPDCADLKMQALLYACGEESPSAIKQRFGAILKSAAVCRKSTALIDSLYPLNELIRRQQCSPLTYAIVREFITALQLNPAFAWWEYQVHLLFHAAVFAHGDGDLAAAESYLGEAETIAPDVIPVLHLQIRLFLDNNRSSEALAAIERRKDLKRYRYRGMNQKVLAQLETDIRSMR